MRAEEQYSPRPLLGPYAHPFAWASASVKRRGVIRGTTDEHIERRWQRTAMPYEIEESPVVKSGTGGRPSALRRALHVATKLLFATGRAAWVTGTTLLVLGVPLIIEMDREAQAQEMENQAMGVLAGGAPGGGGGAAAAPAK